MHSSQATALVLLIGLSPGAVSAQGRQGTTAPPTVSVSPIEIGQHLHFQSLCRGTRSARLASARLRRRGWWVSGCLCTRWIVLLSPDNRCGSVSVGLRHGFHGKIDLH